MKQYNYYKKININNKNEKYNKNLFNNLLNIPEKLFKNLNVINIGAGSGDTTIYFLENQANVTAVDYISDYFNFISYLLNSRKEKFDNRKFIKLISNLKKMNINHKNLDNLKKFYNDLLKETNLNNFVDKMKKNTLLSNWGKSYFHLVLSRN